MSVTCIRNNVFVFLLLSMGHGAFCDNRPDAARQLLQTFQGGCATAGPWTTAAIAQNSQFQQVLLALRNSDPCKPYQAELTSIANLTNSLNRTLGDPNNATYYQSTQELRQLVLGLSGTLQPNASQLWANILGISRNDNAGMGIVNSLITAQQQQLIQSVVQQQVTVAQNAAILQAGASAFGKGQRIQTAQSFTTLMNTLMSEGSGMSLTACLGQSPAASFELGMNLLSLGGSFLSTGLGAGASAVAQLITYGIEGARQANLDRAIMRSDSDLMPVAMMCGLEATTELYCSADDARTLLDLEAGGFSLDGKDKEFWEGFDLLKRRLPVLDSWLLLIRNGLLPQDAATASNQVDVIKQLAAVSATRVSIMGNFAQQTRLYNQDSDPTGKQNILVKTLEETSYELSGNARDSNTPYKIISADEYTYACFLVLGTAVGCPVHTSQDIFDNWVRESLLSVHPTDFATILSNFNNVIFPSVNSTTNLVFSQTITVNPELLLSGCNEPTQNNMSPCEVLRQIEDFLKHVRANPTQNPNRNGLIDKVIALVDDALNTVNNPTPIRAATQWAQAKANAMLGKSASPSDPVGSAETRIAHLFEVFKLINGTQYIDSNVQSFVEWDLIYKLLNHQYPPGAESILRASTNLLNVALENAGVNHLSAIASDLNHARTQSQSNVREFTQYFSNQLSSAVVTLDERAHWSNEVKMGNNRPNGETLGELCALLYSANYNWPKSRWGHDRSKALEICENTKLYSIFNNKITTGQKGKPDGNPDLDVGFLIKNEDLHQPFEDRVCTYHRYLRQQQLEEIDRGLSLRK